MSDEQEGVSNRQLLAAFFAVVALCAVFFSLGFFLGHKERSPESGLATEQVPSSSDAPSALNSPAQQSASDASSAAAATPAAASSDQGRAAAPPHGSPDSSATSSAAETPAPAHDEPSTGSAVKPTPAPRVALQTSIGGPAKKIPPGLLVQVAALGNQQDANNMVSVLQSRGYPALMLTPEQAHASDNLFRVVAGPYKTRADSEKARSKLVAEGFKPFIRP
jgi:cell division septation protein DedD